MSDYLLTQKPNARRGFFDGVKTTPLCIRLDDKSMDIVEREQMRLAVELGTRRGPRPMAIARILHRAASHGLV